MTPDLGYTTPGQLDAAGAFGGRLPLGGQAAVTFPGGDGYSGVATIPHGLGYKPTSVVAGPRDGDANYSFQTTNYTKTTFDVQGFATDGGLPFADFQAGFSWIAI